MGGGRAAAGRRGLPMGEIIRFATRPFDRAEALRVIQYRSPLNPNILKMLRGEALAGTIARTIERSRRDPEWAEQLRRLINA
jgi:hypothetical protein